MATRGTDLDLVAISGSIEGARLELSTGAAIVLGRTGTGFQIPDPHVSIYHAQIGWEGGSYWISDLDSATGTFVDGVKLNKETAELRAGTVVRVGSTELEVVRRRRFSELEIVAIVAPLVLAVIVILLTLTAAGQRASSLVLVWTSPIQRGPAFEPSRELAIPDAYLRSYGMNVRELRIRRVTDFDDDGRDEIWLRYRKRDYVARFDAEGGWVDMGDVPKGCFDVPDEESSPGLPVLDCDGVTYYIHNGKYRPRDHEGVVVWIRPHFEDVSREKIRELIVQAGGTLLKPEPGSQPQPRAKAKVPPGIVGEIYPEDLATERFKDRTRLMPLRFPLREKQKFAGFLASRGVEEPIHYLICEEALPGVAPQVLTQSGALVPLGRPCNVDVALTAWRLGRPALMAFTAEGHQALLADAKIFYGGNAQGVFLNRSHHRLFEWLEAPAGPLIGAAQLKLDGSVMSFRAVADERVLPVGRALIPTGDIEPAPLAVTATLLSRGRAELDPPGCSQIEIDVGAWQCALSGGCLAGNTFYEVRDTGCGNDQSPLMRVTYREGVTTVSTPRLDLRSDVSVRTDGDRTTVISAKFTYRVKTPSLGDAEAP